MVGGLLSMIGFALSSVAPSLLMLFFTHGVLTGMTLDNIFYNLNIFNLSIFFITSLD